MVEKGNSIPDFSPLEWPDDFLMSRAQAETLSRAIGLPIAKQYLAKLHCVSSDGPPTIHFGRKARLRVGDFKQWLSERMSPPRRSTSEVICPIGGLPVGADLKAGGTTWRSHPPSPRSTKAVAARTELAKRSHRPSERKTRI